MTCIIGKAEHTPLTINNGYYKVIITVGVNKTKILFLVRARRGGKMMSRFNYKVNYKDVG